MKTIYVTDLDGTLLDREARVPRETLRLLSVLDEAGVPVTYATARTIQSVKHILADAPKRYPIALMNGVLVCDASAGVKYLSAAYFEESVFETVKKTLERADISPFTYFLKDDVLSTGYTEITNGYMERFMAERVKKYNKPFVRLTEGETYPGRPIYFAAMDTEKKIRRANEACKTIEGVKTACYRDSYEPDFWYLEVFDGKASKKNAVEEIKRLTGAERVVSFGDNFNDIPMFEASDECYAVETAPEEVRSLADGVIGAAAEHGVPLKIAELEGVSL